MRGAKKSSFLEYVLTNYRGVFSVVVILPVSVVFNTYNSLRNRIAFALRSAPAKHKERVKFVQAQIQQWIADGAQEKLCTARSGWKTMSELVPTYKLTNRNIHVDMYDILEIDEARRVVRVEPLVNMGQITSSLIPKGWTLPVVPELDDLTVGGLIMGFGIETSSHKYGLFQFICEAFEVVTAEGKLVRCSKTENSELYYTIPWSYGTLGFLVSAELKIIPAKKYVRLHYRPQYSLNDTVNTFEKESRDTNANEFVETLVYGKDTSVVMTGTLTDKVKNDGSVNPIGRWYKPWFYKHVEQYLLKKKDAIEYIPLRHYYHRHTKSFFWEMEQIIPWGNHPVFRWLLGWALPPQIRLLKYSQTETINRLREEHHIVQDMLVPVSYLKESLQYFHDHYAVYPLWLSPMSVYDNEKHIGLIHPHTKPDGTTNSLFVDIGAYGTPGKPGCLATAELPLLEKFVLDHQGYQALYAKTDLRRDDLRKMFDHSQYDILREQLPYCKQAFDEIYDKVSSKGRTSPSDVRKMMKNRVTTP